VHDKLMHGWLVNMVMIMYVDMWWSLELNRDVFTVS